MWNYVNIPGNAVICMPTYVVYANRPQEEKTKILTKKYIQNNELFMKMVNFLKMEALPSLLKIISVFHKFS